MGEAHEKTKESSEYLKYLTQQAVALQRTMNEIYKNGSNASIMPLKVKVLSHFISVCASFMSRTFSTDGFFLFLPLSGFLVHCPQHGHYPGPAQHHQWHHLYTSQVDT